MILSLFWDLRDRPLRSLIMEGPIKLAYIADVY